MAVLHLQQLTGLTDTDDSELFSVISSLCRRPDF
jgi:hypothetical protein